MTRLGGLGGSNMQKCIPARVLCIDVFLRAINQSLGIMMAKCAPNLFLYQLANLVDIGVFDRLVQCRIRRHHASAESDKSASLLGLFFFRLFPTHTHTRCGSRGGKSPSPCSSHSFTLAPRSTTSSSRRPSIFPRPASLFSTPLSTPAVGSPHIRKCMTALLLVASH